MSRDSEPTLIQGMKEVSPEEAKLLILLGADVYIKHTSGGIRRVEPTAEKAYDEDN